MQFTASEAWLGQAITAARRPRTRWGDTRTRRERSCPFWGKRADRALLTLRKIARTTLSG